MDPEDLRFRCNGPSAAFVIKAKLSTEPPELPVQMAEPARPVPLAVVVCLRESGHANHDYIRTCHPDGRPFHMASLPGHIFNDSWSIGDAGGFYMLVDARTLGVVVGDHPEGAAMVPAASNDIPPGLLSFFATHRGGRAGGSSAGRAIRRCLGN
ncbi:hypothetical protein QQX98_012183 [Neonectria punicea]|uniref:Uncharacterized protein n=1 Tax=Neonectria punicea TaxID=979145 RepID=A0ABR1GJJ7_9HYPO